MTIPSDKPSRFGIQSYHVLLLVALLALGIASRLAWADIPNFKPVTAIAIFCGFYFQRRWIGFAVAGMMMFLSDMVLGFYQWPVMISVYGSILLACLFGSAIAHRIKNTNLALSQFATFSGAALLMSLLFFLVTNAAVVVAGWYPLSFSGLASSYVAGLPFLKYTMIGDFCFTNGIFFVYLTMQQRNVWSFLPGIPNVVNLHSQGKIA